MDLIKTPNIYQYLAASQTEPVEAKGQLISDFLSSNLPKSELNFFEGYTQSPFIRTSLVITSAEFVGKFKTQALGGSNLRSTSKNLRTASAQIFKAKNQFVDESIVDGPQKRSK